MIKSVKIKTIRGEYVFPVVDELPKGWSVVKGVQMTPAGYVWVSNGKSYSSCCRQHALIKREKLISEPIPHETEKDDSQDTGD